MNAMQTGIVTLLRSAVSGEMLVLPKGFNLEAAREGIKAHHMASLVYAGAVHCGFGRENPIMQALFRSYCRAMQISERQMTELKRLCTAFEEGGIDYMPLKGSVLKDLYPRPELRMMGDADILIRTEQYDQIADIMRGLGYQDGGEWGHHAAWNSPSLCVELHKQLVPEDNARYAAYYRDGWAFAKPVKGYFHAMKVEDAFIFLLVHFAKHFEATGIGCRHLVDLWVYLRKYPDMDWNSIEKELDKLQLLDFWGNIRRVIAYWFEDGAGDEKSEFITQHIFSNGSWGNREIWALSRGLYDIGDGNSVAEGRKRYILKRIFPGKASLESEYPVLRKTPCLLPAVWMVHIVRKLCSGPRVWKRHGKNIFLLNKDKLESRRQMLDYVGLGHSR